MYLIWLGLRFPTCYFIVYCSFGQFTYIHHGNSYIQLWPFSDVTSFFRVKWKLAKRLQLQFGACQNYTYKIKLEMHLYEILDWYPYPINYYCCCNGWKLISTIIIFPYTINSVKVLHCFSASVKLSIIPCIIIANPLPASGNRNGNKMQINIVH